MMLARGLLRRSTVSLADPRPPGPRRRTLSFVQPGRPSTRTPRGVSVRRRRTARRSRHRCATAHSSGCGAVSAWWRRRSNGSGPVARFDGGSVHAPAGVHRRRHHLGHGHLLHSSSAFIWHVAAPAAWQQLRASRTGQQASARRDEAAIAHAALPHRLSASPGRRVLTLVPQHPRTAPARHRAGHERALDRGPRRPVSRSSSRRPTRACSALSARWLVVATAAPRRHLAATMRLASGGSRRRPSRRPRTSSASTFTLDRYRSARGSA